MAVRYFGSSDGAFYRVDTEKYVDWPRDNFDELMAEHRIVMEGDFSWWYHDFANGQLIKKLDELQDRFTPEVNEVIFSLNGHQTTDVIEAIRGFDYRAMESLFGALSEIDEIAAYVIPGFSQGEATFVLGLSEDLKKVVWEDSIATELQENIYGSNVELEGVDEHGVEIDDHGAVPSSEVDRLDDYMKEHYDAVPVIPTLTLSL